MELNPLEFLIVKATPPKPADGRIKVWRGENGLVEMWADGTIHPVAGEDVDMGKLEFWSASGGQAAFNITPIVAKIDQINAITTRTTQNGLDNFVTALDPLGLDYFAPLGAKLATKGNELTFTPETMGGGAVYFAPSKDSNAAIYGARIQSSAYFRVLLDDPTAQIGKPFTAVELIQGRNTFSTDEGEIYPPGAYIFRLDGTSALGFDMLPKYEAQEGVVTQPQGFLNFQIEILSTAEPPLYVAWYDNEGNLVNAVNTEDPQDVRTDTNGLEKQELVTSARLRDILSNIFAAAAVDPTGAGRVYLPWKYEEWMKPASTTPAYDLTKAKVDAVNAAPRTTKDGNPNYAGQLLPRPVIIMPNLDYYSDPTVKLALNKSSDGKAAIAIGLDKVAPKDLTFSILPEKTPYGIREIELRSTGWFSVQFNVPNDLDEIVSHRVISARNATTNNDLLLVDGKNYVMGKIYPEGIYTFRATDTAGVTFTLLAKATIGGVSQDSNIGAFLQITAIKYGVGADYYNVWYENDGAVAKIVNASDPTDQRTSLHGLNLIRPVEPGDLDQLRSLIDQRAISIWKIENYVDANGVIYAVVFNTSGKVVRVTNAADATKTLSVPTNGSLPAGLKSQSPAADPNADVTALVVDLRRTIDNTERLIGYEDLGEKGDTLNIDWSVGKLKKIITLSGDLTINFTTPPQFSTLVELFIRQKKGNGFKVVAITAPQLMHDPQKNVSASVDEISWMRAFYIGNEYYMADKQQI